MNKWHKYPKENPPEFGTYLVTTYWDTSLSSVVLTLDWVDGWQTDSSNPLYNKLCDNVVAWQYLPEPYKE